MANEIQIAGVSYTDESIVSGNALLVQSLDGDELQYNTFDATLELGEGAEAPAYEYGSIVLAYHGSKRLGKFYLTTMTRVGKTRYSIACVSAVGMLANSRHYGNIYAGVPLPVIIAEVIGGEVPFTVRPELAQILVYGWLPIATRRENLHQILFATGTAALRDENGDIFISALTDELRKAIPDNRIYLNGSVQYPEAVTKVTVSEHTFANTTGDETVTLFEGLVSAENITTPNGLSTTGSIILFQEPMHDLQAVNSTIIESGVNYAVVSPSSSCLLTGKKYTHTIRQVTRTTAAARSNSAENQINISDATLVSLANSENVADRIMEYYSSAKTVEVDIVMDGEQAGDAVQFNDPFDDATDGIIHSMDITLSGVLKARAEIIADYSPVSPGNFYTNVELIATARTWTVPAGTRQIRVVLIGGGAGGYSGAQGENGGTSQNGMGDGGKGGAAGTGGTGGNILIFTLEVNAGESFAASPGQGGAGGVNSAYENIAGSNGTESTFGEYSSAQGTNSATGYTDLFSGVTYGLPGIAGIDGGDGARSDNDFVAESVTFNGTTWEGGENSSNRTRTWTGGGVRAYGGGGGGAAVGSAGNTAGEADIWYDSTKKDYMLFGGDGGKGGDAIPGENASVLGAGGHGGHGGGGGGGGGGGESGGDAVVRDIWSGNGGIGGLGSDGGAGAPGCILIYY